MAYHVVILEKEIAKDENDNPIWEPLEYTLVDDDGNYIGTYFGTYDSALSEKDRLENLDKDKPQ